MKKRKDQIITFVVAFVISFVSLGCVVLGVFATGGSHEKTNDNGVVPSSSEYLPVYEHNQNILLISCDWRGGKAEFFAVIQINPVKRKINITVLPTDTLATVNITTDTLAGLYDYGGSLMAVEAVQNACGIKINRYMRFAMNDLYTFIDTMGGIEYNVTKSTKEINEGFQTLDGRRMFNLIFTQENSEQQAKIASKLFEEFINSSFKDYTQSRSKEVFNLLTKLSDTSLTAFDYEYRKEAVNYLLSAKQPGKVIEISGNYDGENSGYELSEEALTNLKSGFWLEKSN